MNTQSISGVLCVMLLCFSTHAEELSESPGSSFPVPAWERESLNAGGTGPYRHQINLYDDDGVVIDPKTSTDPYSPIVTCMKCHDVGTISCGWHFNAGKEGVIDGRDGEPWWWTDSRTQTQIPLSLRDWSNALKPQEIGLSAWDFTLRFGGYTTGGGWEPTEGESDPSARWGISGKLRVDCLICHLASREFDHEEWNKQIERENFKWASTAAAPFARVRGAAKNLPADYDPEMDLFGENEDLPVVTYDVNHFDAGKRIFLDIVSQVPNDNCYRCHSNETLGPGAMPAWHVDEDIHIVRGMSCVDCHRHGIDHQITRGDPHDPLVNSDPARGTLSCVGCHYGYETVDGQKFAGGHFAAPRPKHAGFPPLHFDELTCTACHSGPRPAANTLMTQTAMAHQLGLASEHRTSKSLPHLVSPVFAENQHGQLAPYRAGWPSYWARAGEDGKLTPLTIDELEQLVLPKLPATDHEHSAESLTKQQIQEVLTQLGDDARYIAGGIVYGVGTADEGATEAAPSLWPLAHNVRPAADSLGSGGCTDCHANDAAIDFGSTAPAGRLSELPIIPQAAMNTLRDYDGARMSLWNASFAGRSYFKLFAWVSLTATALLLIVLTQRLVARLADQEATL